MRLCINRLLLSAFVALGAVMHHARANKVYIPAILDNTVSVVDPATDKLVATIPVGKSPWAIAVSTDDRRAYVANLASDTVSVISTTTNTVIATIPVAPGPLSIAVTPDNSTVYVACSSGYGIAVIDAATNTMIGKLIPTYPEAPISVVVSPDGSKVYASYTDLYEIKTATNDVADKITTGVGVSAMVITPDGSTLYGVGNNAVTVVNLVTHVVTGSIPVGSHPSAIAISPDGSKIYVSNQNDNTVSIISTATNSVIAPSIPVGPAPAGLTVTPDGSTLFVASSSYFYEKGQVFPISTETNSVGAPIFIGYGPSYGQFIEPPARFAGEPGTATCVGVTFYHLVQRFHSIDGAAMTLGYPSVKALSAAYTAYCA